MKAVLSLAARLVEVLPLKEASTAIADCESAAKQVQEAGTGRGCNCKVKMAYGSGLEKYQYDSHVFLA